MSLFGPSTATKPSLFGSTNASTSLPSSTSTPSLFGNAAPTAQSNIAFGPLGGGQAPSQPNAPSGVNQPMQQPNVFGGAVTPRQSTFLNAPPSVSTGPVGDSSGSSMRRSIAPVWQPGSVLGIRERSVPDQMQVLLQKWSPETPSCSFTTYFYDQPPSGTAPFFAPDPGEDSEKWEDAYQKRPFPDAVPHLHKGFASLGARLRTQVQAVTKLQQRIHEINASLDNILAKHDLEISVKVVEAKRKHVALSQRCLKLATKIQILRNRGYNLDGAEEELKSSLKRLERNSFDPELTGRSEEIWARMVGIRERLRFLQVEFDKEGAGDQSRDGNALDEEKITMTKKVLSDFDQQIAHLQRQFEEVRQELEEHEIRG